MDSSSSDSDSMDEVPTFTIGSNVLTSGQSHPSTLKGPIPIKRTKNNFTLSSALDPGIDVPESYLSIFPEKSPFDGKNKMKNLSAKISSDKFLEKSVVFQPGFEKQFTVPPYLEGKKKVRRDRMKERDKTSGSKWFNMAAPEMTEEKKNDLMLLQMRGVLDPKHFYKRSSMKVLPKYFEIGTVIADPVDFYHARVPKRQRKQTLVDELLADAKFRQFQKRKYAEAIMNQPQKIFHSHHNKKKSKLKGARFSDNKKSKKK